MRALPRSAPPTSRRNGLGASGRIVEYVAESHRSAEQAGVTTIDLSDERDADGKSKRPGTLPSGSPRAPGLTIRDWPHRLVTAIGCDAYVCSRDQAEK